MKIILLIALIYLVNTLFITTIIDIILMGALSFRFSIKSVKKNFLISKENTIDWQDGNVYPRGIRNLFLKYGFKVKYCAGNLNALKREVSKGNPVIVMVRTHVGKRWFHYVPVVGYDEQYIFVAESMKELVNCGEKLLHIILAGLNSFVQKLDYIIEASGYYGNANMIS